VLMGRGGRLPIRHGWEHGLSWTPLPVCG
jgi:hypothetical protein